MEDKRELAVFDFDDTLIYTSAQILVRDANGIIKKAIDTATYNSTVDKSTFLSEGDKFDFSQFNSVGIAIKEKVRPEFFILTNRIRNRFPSIILTSRESANVIYSFLLKRGVEVNDTFAVYCTSGENDVWEGNNDAEKKYNVLRMLHDRLGFRKFFIYEDSPANIDAMSHAPGEIVIMKLASNEECKAYDRPKDNDVVSIPGIFMTRQWKHLVEKYPILKNVEFDIIGSPLRFGQLLCNTICSDYRDKENMSDQTRDIMDTLFKDIRMDPFYEENYSTYVRLNQEQ